MCFPSLCFVALALADGEMNGFGHGINEGRGWGDLGGRGMVDGKVGHARPDLHTADFDEEQNTRSDREDVTHMSHGRDGVTVIHGNRHFV